MSAEQIAEGIGGRVPRSDIASVYLNLQALEDAGIVRHVHLGHDPGLHALAMAGECEYLTCERCAAYRAVAPTELDAVREPIERLFVVCWVGALSFWRFANVEEKWSARLRGPNATG